MKDDVMKRDERRPLSAEMREELRRLDSRPDEQRDGMEMPEIADWRGAVRGKHYSEAGRLREAGPSGAADALRDLRSVLAVASDAVSMAHDLADQLGQPGADPVGLRPISLATLEKIKVLLNNGTSPNDVS